MLVIVTVLPNFLKINNKARNLPLLGEGNPNVKSVTTKC